MKKPLSCIGACRRITPTSAICTARACIAVAAVALLFALGNFSATADEPVYKLFGLEVGGYSPGEDVAAIVNQEFGSRASIADWEEIKKQFGQSEADLKTFCDKIGLAPNGTACVTLGGKRIWQDGRQYFIYRADHKRPEDFLLHDQMQNFFLLLGSWVDARPVVVKINGFNTADAAKFAKWDEMRTAREKTVPAKMKAMAGAYTLESVSGKKLPATFDHEGNSVQVLSGTFTINADATCKSNMDFVPPSGKEMKMERHAAYKLEGRDLNTLNMQWEGAGMTTGTVSGNTFTMENEGMVYVFKK